MSKDNSARSLAMAMGDAMEDTIKSMGMVTVTSLTGRIQQWRAFGILMVGRLSIVLSAVANVRLMTTCLLPAQVGRYSVMMAFALWFSLTLISPAGNYINRQYMDWLYRGTLWHEFKRYAGLLALIASVAGLASFVAIRLKLLDLSMGVNEVVLCVVGILIFLTVNSMLIGSLNLLGHRDIYVLYTSATAWLSLACSVILTGFFGHQAELWIAGQVLGWAFVSVLAYLSLRRRVNAVVAPIEDASASRDGGPPHQGLWAFAWPLVISTSFYWFQVQGYRIELEHWVGAAAIGLITTGLLLGANPISIIDTLLGELLRPQYYKAIASNDRGTQEAAWSQMAATFLTSLIPITILIGLSGPFLAAVLVGPPFQSVAGFVLWGVLAEFIRAIYSLYLLAAQTRFHTKATLRPSVVGAVIVLVTIVPAAHWNLYTGTGLPLVLGMAGATIYLARSLRAVFTARLPIRRIVEGTMCSAPIALVLLGAHVLIPHPSFVASVSVLSIGAFVTLGVQAYLAYGWTNFRSESMAGVA